MRLRAHGLLAGLALAATAISTAAWPAPPTSRGEQFLPVGLQECAARSERALAAEGFTNNRYNGGGAMGASKGIHSAIITCNEVPGNQTVANIFVASEGPMNSGIPDAERVRLQQRMSEPGFGGRFAGGGGRGDRRDGDGGGCNWPDGQDPRFPSDPGRGSSNGRAHQGYVNGGTRASVAQIIANRFEAIRGCASPEVYARLYGDASAAIAEVGRRFANWRDGQDSSAPRNDPGRGVSNAQGHYQAAMGSRGPGFSRAIEERLRVLNGTVGVDTYAQLYAELSVLIANASRAR